MVFRKHQASANICIIILSPAYVSSVKHRASAIILSITPSPACTSVDKREASANTHSNISSSPRASEFDHQLIAGARRVVPAPMSTDQVYHAPVARRQLRYDNVKTADMVQVWLLYSVFLTQNSTGVADD